MDAISLERPTAAMMDQIIAYRQEFLEAGDSMDGCGSLRRMPDPQEWLEQVKMLSDKKTVPPQWVVSTQFVGIRPGDGRLVGMLQVRHEMNEFLRMYAGHIGYSVRPGERRKGYARQMLALCLPYCKTLGLERVMVSCLTQNEGSRRTILDNGGVYDKTVLEPKEGVYLEQYWITL